MEATWLLSMLSLNTQHEPCLSIYFLHIHFNAQYFTLHKRIHTGFDTKLQDFCGTGAGRCLEVVGSLGWLRGACCTVTWGVSEAMFSATLTSPESRLGLSQGKLQRFSEPCSGSVRFVRVQSRLSCLNYAPSGIRLGSGFSQALSGTPSVSLYRTH